LKTCILEFLRTTAPGLRRWPAGAHHVLAHAALTEVDAEFEQLPVNPGAPPTGILPAHLADQISDFAGSARSTALASSHLPSPEPAKASTMPGHDRFGLQDGQGRTPVAPDAGEPDPRPTGCWGQLAAFFHGALQHADLVAQRKFSSASTTQTLRDFERHNCWL